jgi:hypothetical protein
LDENKKTYDFYVISTPNGVTTIRRGWFFGRVGRGKFSPLFFFNLT